MKQLQLLLFLLLTITSTAQKSNKKKCSKIYPNNFSSVAVVLLNPQTIRDTIGITQIKFQCVYSAMTTHKIMFDKFGKWSTIIPTAKKSSPILKWENIDLFSNGNTYTVYTHGIETSGEIYASIMVLDSEKKDVLSQNHSEKEKIIEHFSNAIRDKKSSKKSEFYDTYWNEIEYEFVKILQKNKKKISSQNNTFLLSA
jgi:hypothetical protein